jgi:peptide/nickel transport system permease protein
MSVGGQWLRFALRRGLTLMLSLWVLVTATFLVLQLVPGDPARAGLGLSAPKSQVDARRDALNLDEPLLTQYTRYIGGALRGDFGESFTNQRPVGDIIRERFPATLKLALSAFAIALLAGVAGGLTIGILTRGGRHPLAAGAFSVGTGTLISIPDFLVATGFVALFAVGLGWLPVAGQAGLDSYVLPVASLALPTAAALARVARVETLKTLDQEYMLVARSKRLPLRRLYLRHLLPNSTTATLTLGGLVLGGLIASTVIVENVFAWPGLGSAITHAILDKDYPLVQGIVLLLGSIALVANTLVDVVLGLLDPRSLIRES